MPLTEARDSRVLAILKSEAGDALEEMARWRPVGWALPARVVLGRIAGWPEDRVEQLARGPVEAFFAALGR